MTTLGLLWIPTTDQLQVRNNATQVPHTNSTGSTRRKVLAITASIFDPLGLLSPAAIAYKTFIQKLWQDKLQRDEPLPIHFQQEWNRLHQTIPQLLQIKINRNVICSNVINLQLHGFCDSNNEPIELASKFAPPTATTIYLGNFCAPHQRWHLCNN